jgi:two-component system chemotaxis response regulator CheY
VAQRPAAQAPGRQDLSGTRILTLDDDQTMRSIIRSVLAKSGCSEVVEASTGREALQLFGMDPVDLVICDWMMEPMDGFAFLTELRKSGKGANVPAIMLTANADPADAVKARHLNIAAWLVKPIAANRLLERICSVLSLPTQLFSLGKDPQIDLSSLADQYREKLAYELRDLEELVASFQQHGKSDIDRNWSSMIRIFHGIKGQAGTFGYDLITALAANGQNLLRAAELNVGVILKFQRQLHQALSTLVKAMSHILRTDVKGNGGDVGNRLLAKINETVLPLRQLMEAELKHAKAS